MKIIAKFPSTCNVCNGRIKTGTEIEWEKGKGARHLDCKAVAIPADALKIHGGSGYGCHGWKAGDVLRNKDRLIGSTREKKMAEYRAAQEDRDTRFPLDGPEFLYVIQASSRYFREDGLSFGVGDESGYTYSAACRAATDEESAPLREKLAADERRRAAMNELKTIAAEICKQGEHPEGDNSPEGETIPIGKGQDIHGGGEWFVLGPAWIWYVQNNGTDGGDWRFNNVRTGGAGGIGSRVPASPELAERIRTVHSASIL